MYSSNRSLQNQDSNLSLQTSSEEEIQILQSKLIQIHHKLIQQLDVSKEQQLQIIKLTKQNSSLKRSLQNQANSLGSEEQYLSFGNYEHHSHEKQNMRVHNHQLGHSAVTYQYESITRQKIQLLENDLEAMRNKVLFEIKEKNKYKEDIEELRKINRKLENTQSWEKRYLEMETKYYREKKYNNDLVLEKSNLMKKLTEENIKFKRVQEELINVNKISIIHDKNMNFLSQSNIVAEKQQKEIDELKNKIDKLNKNIEIREVEFKEGAMQRKKRKGFEETRDLIRKLEDAENTIRKQKKN